MTSNVPPEPVFDHEAHKSIRAKVETMRSAGARLIAIIAQENENGTIDLHYTFDQKDAIVDIPLTILPEWEMDSVADIYAGAMNMERENIDLFGLRFKGQVPGLLLDAGKSMVSPLRKKQVEELKKGRTRV
jgi:Ni,Fe-hydrogenase III component G